MGDILTIEEIKQKYPNEWVLLENPVIDNTKVLSGIPIYHAKDKREIAYQGINWRENFSGATIVYTGEFAKNRMFCL
jgi:hypothetical protein